MRTRRSILRHSAGHCGSSARAQRPGPRQKRRAEAPCPDAGARTTQELRGAARCCALRHGALAREHLRVHCPDETELTHAGAARKRTA